MQHEMTNMSISAHATSSLGLLNDAESPSVNGLTPERDAQLISQTDQDLDCDEIDLDDDGPGAKRTDLEAQNSIHDTDSSPEAEVQEPVTKYKLCKKFMKTPCNHCYHTVCLQKWMEIRLECPTCRQQIPQIAD